MLIFPLRKADALQRRVYARLDETVDRAGEAMDYAASAPVFKAWSTAQHQVTGGKSYGNVRGQHGRIAAGLVAEISFDDAAGAIEFGIDVVDDGEWDKVIKGVYTGISPGGAAARRKEPSGVVRYSVTSLNEVSLVDVPCSPAAAFTLIKADGAEEQIAFAQPREAAPFDAGAAGAALTKALMDAASPEEHAALLAPIPADHLQKMFGALSGDVTGPLLSATQRQALAEAGAALADGSYPVVDAETLAAGVAALSKAALSKAALSKAALSKAALSKAALSKAAGDCADIRAHLAARAEALGLPHPEATPLIKGLFTVGRLSELIAALAGLAADVADEAGWEGDGSDVPGRLAAWIATGTAILVAMAGEEGAEAVAALQAVTARLPAAVVEDDAGAAEMEKAASSLVDPSLLLVATRDLAASRGLLAKAHGSIAAMRAELAVLKAQPAPGGPRLRAVARGDDIGTPEPNGNDLLLKAHEAMPDGIEKARAATRLVMAGILPGLNS